MPIAAHPTEVIRILHLEDSVLDHELVRRTLERDGWRVELQRSEQLDDFVQRLTQQPFDLILADFRLPGFTAIEAWEALQRLPRQPPFVLLSGAIGETTAVEVMQRGISDYLLKDQLPRLGRVIERAIEIEQTRRAKRASEQELAASQARLSQLTEHLQSSIEQERAAIAREVHDDIGGALTAVKFDLAWIGRHSQDPGVLAHCQAAAEMLQQALEASQRIMLSLRPAILDQGLVAAVAWLAAGFEKRSGVPVRLQLGREQLELPRALQLVAFRTVQEALTNISKHAQCSAVQIELSDAGATLTVEVSDNGRGMLADDLQKPRSFGLKGLQERARAVGGWLDLSHPAGGGTSVILSVPLSPGATVLEEDA